MFNRLPIKSEAEKGIQEAQISMNFSAAQLQEQIYQVEVMDAT